MRRAAALMLWLGTLPANSQEIFDLLLKGGHVIDPKNGRDQRLDIGIISGRIRRIASSLPAAQSRNTVDVSEYYVTPGLIDTNAHLWTSIKPGGLNPDHNTLRFGVTTVVDAGSTDAASFEQFKSEIIDHATVRVLAFLNLSSPAHEASSAVLRKYPEHIVGISAESGQLRQAEDFARATETVVMTNFGPQPDPSVSLRAGDIYTRLYGREEVNRFSEIWSTAQKRGVLFDASHGDEGLWFRVAIPAIRQGLIPDTISTGMNSQSVMLPRATMTNVLSKFLAMGLTLGQAIERTTVGPAKAIRRPELGSLNEGGVADIAVFELAKGLFAFLDSGHAKLTADRQLRCVLTVRNGKVVWDTEGLSLADWKNAGPYTNFK